MEKEDIKVLEALDAFYPCIDGVINVAKNYALNINKKASCDLVVPSAQKKSNYVDKEDFKVIRCKSSSAPEGYRNALPKLDRTLNKKLKNGNYDIIHTHSPFALGYYLLRFGKKNHIPVVATLHTQYKEDFNRVLKGFKPLVNFMMKYIMRVYNHADRVWTVNSASCEILRKYGFKGKIEIVRNGTDLVFPDNAQELIDKVNKAHNLENQKNVFLFVGRIAMYKNLPLMAESLRILKEKGIDYKMIIVGGGFDFEEFKKMVKDLGIDDRFIFTGSIKDRNLLQGYYLRSDLFLFPSTFDTSSLSPVEAAAHKLPTLLIKDSYTAEGIVDDVNGFLANKTAEDYANKILDIISTEGMIKKVGEEAYRSVYRSWEMVADEVVEKYRVIIKEYQENYEKNKTKRLKKTQVIRL